MAKTTNKRRTTKKSTPIHHLTTLPQWQRLLLWAVSLMLVIFAIAMMLVQPIAGAIWLIAAILLMPPAVSRLKLGMTKQVIFSLVLSIIGLLISVILGNSDHQPSKTLDTSTQIASQAHDIAARRAKQTADSISDGISDGILLGTDDATKNNHHTDASDGRIINTMSLGDDISTAIKSSIEDITKPITEPITQLGKSIQSVSDQLNQFGNQSDDSPSANSQDDSQNSDQVNDNDAITCRIVGVSDGDTATCLDAQKQQLKIRFAQIDAPEKGQDFGQAAKKQLSELIFDKQVTLAVHDKDRYGRTVAEVFVDGKNINKQMVATGYAWAYRAYMTDSDYLLLETQAKSQGIGLWSSPNPIYPEDYRKAKKTN